MNFYRQLPHRAPSARAHCNSLEAFPLSIPTSRLAPSNCVLRARASHQAALALVSMADHRSFGFALSLEELKERALCKWNFPMMRLFEKLTEVHAAFVESLRLDGRLIVFIVNVDWLLE